MPIRKTFLFSLLLVSAVLSWPLSAKTEMHLVTYLGSDGSTSYQAASSKVFNAEHIARAALAEMGLDLKVSQLPAMRALQQANAGHVDGDLWRLSGTEQHFDNLIAVAEPLCYASIYFYTLLDRTESNYWDSLQDPRIILLPETQALFEQLPDRQKVHPAIQALSISQALRALLRDDGNMILLPEGLIEVIEQEQKGSLPWVLKLHPRVAQLPAKLLLNSQHSGVADKLSKQIRTSKKDFAQQESQANSSQIACR